MISNIAKGRWTIWAAGLAKYIQSIKKKKGDTLHDVLATIGFGLFTGGMVAPALYYGTIGKYASKGAVAVAPYLAAAGLGAAIGVTAVTVGTSKLEEAGILREGATLDYLQQHKSVESAWENIYSPTAIKDNVSTIWNYYNPFD